MTIPEIGEIAIHQMYRKLGTSLDSTNKNQPVEYYAFTTQYSTALLCKKFSISSSRSHEKEDNIRLNNSLFSSVTLINDESAIGTALIMLHLVFCLHWKKDAPKLAFSVSDQP